MIKKTFSAHGEMRLSVEDAIVFIDVEGPWNVEFFEALHIKLAKIATQIKVEHYAVLLSLYGDALAVDSALAFHQQFLANIKAKAVAINLKYCATPSSSRDMCSKVYSKVNLTHEFFNDSASAKHWLHEILAN